MAKLQAFALKEQAEDQARYNSHVPGPWRSLPDWPTASVSFCVRCNASLAIDTKPLRLFRELRGSALYTECKDNVSTIPQKR